MYHTFVVVWSQLLLLLGLLCISISVPGGAIGVESKWKSPSHAAHADSRGFYLHALTMLTLRSTYSHNRHQYPIGNLSGRDVVVDLKHTLYICTAFSADEQ